jgi:hypothetical protein
MRILQGTPKLRVPAAIEFTAHGLSDELAAVFLAPIDVPDEVIGKGHGHAFNACHFILQV